MLTKNELKDIALLLNKKYRTERKKFLVEGRKLISEALNSGFKCEMILFTNHFNETNPDFLGDEILRGIRLETIKQIDIERISDTKTPQGIVGVFFDKHVKQFEARSNKIVALENISDPGNLGTILRNCDWFGFDEIILSGDCAEIFNPKVIRASAGSVFHLNIYTEKNFYDLMRELRKKDFKILCADLNGENLYELESPAKLVAVFCNEGNGPTNELLSITDLKVTIPSKGKAESLNVASASAVILSNLSSN
jgi:TrmH family RNA methyltransferase